MNAFLKLAYVDLKLYLRNIIAVFFTLAFPVLMLFLFGAMYGNKPSPIFDGRGSMDVTVPGYIASIVIATTGLMVLPLELVSRRQQGVLRRFRASPLPSSAVLGAQLAVNLMMTFISSALLVAGGVLVYGIVLPQDPLAVLLGILLGCLSIFALGLIIASLVHSVATARAVTMLIFYPMMFFSGGTLPFQFLPKAVQDAAAFMPVTYVVNLVKNLWFGQGWDLTAVAILLGLALVCAAASAAWFRWE